MEEYKAANPDREVTWDKIDSGMDTSLTGQRVCSYIQLIYQKIKNVINIIHVTTGTPAKSPPKKYLKVLSLIKTGMPSVIHNENPLSALHPKVVALLEYLLTITNVMAL